MESSYDLVVIGAGPGGYVAAIRAGQLGLKTAIIEKENLGGVCLNWGCIPSKSLLKNAEVLSYIHRADEFGLKFDNFHADYSVAISRSRSVVDRNTKGVAYLLDKNKVEHISGTGKILGPGKVEVSPDGGAIGVEFAYIYRMYGVEVTIVELLPRLVPNEDEDISTHLERAFRSQGINIMTGAGVSGVETTGSGVAVSISKDGATETVACDKVLVAIGVAPNIEGLGLDSAGIATENSGIRVDEVFATNVPGVYAVGDVNGKMPLAHVASAQAVTAVEHIAGMDTQPLDYTYMPRATYCQPQIASFGLTEAQARERGHEVNIGTFNVMANGKALAMGETAGVVKLVVDAQYGELLGGHMIGPEVTELLGELSMTKMLEGTTLELGWAVHAHPSLSEMLKEAALGAQGKSIHM